MAGVGNTDRLGQFRTSVVARGYQQEVIGLEPTARVEKTTCLRRPICQAVLPCVEAWPLGGRSPSRFGSSPIALASVGSSAGGDWELAEFAYLRTACASRIRAASI